MCVFSSVSVYLTCYTVWSHLIIIINFYRYLLYMIDITEVTVSPQNVAISCQTVNIFSVVKHLICSDIFLHCVFQVVMKQNAVIEHLKQKKTMTPAEREENQRFVSKICGCENEEIFCMWSKVSFCKVYIEVLWVIGKIFSSIKVNAELWQHYASETLK